MDDKKFIIKEDKILGKKDTTKKKRVLTPELLEMIAKVQGVKRTVVK